jgi:proteasome accessory factor C
MAAKRPRTQESLVLFLSLVPYVMDRGEVSVDEAAGAFGRHPHEITQAVELIACAGIPGETSAYLHADLFDIDWDRFIDEGIIRFEHTIVIDSPPGFSAREMSALIAGLQYLAQHPAWAGRADITSLLDRLAVGTNTTVVKTAPPTKTLEAISDAIERQHQLDIVYVNKRGEKDERRVDPLALEPRDDLWFFRAWCHTRQALRTFRVDRIERLHATDHPAAVHDDWLAPEQWSVFSPSVHDLVATIEFSPQSLPLIAEYLDRNTAPENQGELMRADVPFAHTASLTRFAARYPGLVRVVGPAEAVDAVGQWAQAALNNYP